MKKLILILIVLLNIMSCSTAEKIEDVVVIGGGLMGSSTAWELSNYRQKVLLIEQQDSVYTFGSSFGEARISRSLGPQNDIFSFLQQTSVNQTTQLIAYLNEGETEELHSMEDIYTSSPVTYIYSMSQSKEVEELLDGQRDKYEHTSTPKQASEKFGMKISDTTIVIREYKEYSGTLNPKILIEKLHQGIKKAGNRVEYGLKVTSLKKADGVYKIKTTNTKTGEIKVILSKKIVAAAGAYNGKLTKEIAPYFNDLISPKRLFLSFLSIDPNKYDRLTMEQKNKLKEFYPVIYLDSDQFFYSMIEKYDLQNRPLLKIGGHLLRTDIKDLDAVWELELTSQEIQWSKEITVDYFIKLNLPLGISDLEFSRGYSCVYSLTSSEIPYVTNAIKEDTEVDSSFVLVGGMSGIGAKGSLAYGLMAANLILNKDDSSQMYQKTKTVLGSDRLMKDIRDLKE